MPFLAATPGFPIGGFNDRVWPEKTDEARFGFWVHNNRVWLEPDDEYIFDDGEEPGFVIEVGNGVYWSRHGVWIGAR
jgi:hypothetical protein